MKLWKVIGLVLVLPMNVQAELVGVEVGKLTKGGNGCSSDSTGINDYQVTGLQRKSCNISIPVRVENGYQIAFQYADFLGEINGKGTLNYELFFAGVRGMRRALKLETNSEIGFVKKDLIPNKDWSRCGADVNVRISTSIRTRNETDQLALNEINFTLVSRQCPTTSAPDE